jgi:hypothetical protein
VNLSRKRLIKLSKAGQESVYWDDLFVVYGSIEEPKDRIGREPQEFFVVLDGKRVIEKKEFTSEWQRNSGTLDFSLQGFSINATALFFKTGFEVKHEVKYRDGTKIRRYRKRTQEWLFRTAVGSKKRDRRSNTSDSSCKEVESILKPIKGPRKGGSRIRVAEY